MLTLSRRVDQAIVIGEGPRKITVTVVEIDRGKVRLGISGPLDVPVHREEVRQAIDKTKEEDNR